MDSANDKVLSEKEKLLREIKAHYSNEPVPEEPSRIETPETDTPSAKESEADILEEQETDTPVIMKAVSPLPKHTKSIWFIPISVVLTAIGVVLGHISPITSGIPKAPWVRYTYIALGVVGLFFGLKFISDALSGSAINENTALGRLVTTGIYAKTRNPIYLGVILISTAILFFSGNAFMYVVPFILYLVLTILVKRYEEPLLEERFGAEYRDYITSTYRVVPFSK